MPYQYRVVTHAGKIYVEYLDPSCKEKKWTRVQDSLYSALMHRHFDLEFITIWGAKWWIRRQIRKDMQAATVPVVVWGPYP